MSHSTNYPHPLSQTMEVIRRHNHWLRIACDFPSSDAFFSLVHGLLMYTHDNLLKIPLFPPDTGPKSLADIAATMGHPRREVAKVHISALADELLAVSILASWLFGDGHTRNMPPTSSYHRRVEMYEAWSEDEIPAPAPVSVLLSDNERAVLLRDPKFTAVHMTLMRAYHGNPRHGPCIGVIFFVLMLRVAEIDRIVQNEFTDEGFDVAQMEILRRYLLSEVRAFLLAPMDFDNANEIWYTWWISITSTIRANDFHRMTIAVETRETLNQQRADELRKSTEKKRNMRQAAKLRKKQGGAEIPQSCITVDDEEDDDDEDISGIVVNVP